MTYANFLEMCEFNHYHYLLPGPNFTSGILKQVPSLMLLSQCCEELTQQVIVWWPCLVFHSWEIMSAKGEGGYFTVHIEGHAIPLIKYLTVILALYSIQTTGATHVIVRSRFSLLSWFTFQMAVCTTLLHICFIKHLIGHHWGGLFGPSFFFWSPDHSVILHRNSQLENKLVYLYILICFFPLISFKIFMSSLWTACQVSCIAVIFIKQNEAPLHPRTICSLLLHRWATLHPINSNYTSKNLSFKKKK